MFGGVATGVMYAAEAEKPMASTTAVGLAPKDSAMDKPIGHSSAAAAVLDINWVNRPVITNSTAVRGFLTTAVFLPGNYIAITAVNCYSGHVCGRGREANGQYYGRRAGAQRLGNGQTNRAQQRGCGGVGHKLGQHTSNQEQYCSQYDF